MDHSSPAGLSWPESGAAPSVTGAADFGPAGDPPSALSPSRAADFMTCPLLYRFRVIDRIPEPPTPATARGTLVHAVLERLFDRPAASRTPAAAREMLVPEWERLAEADPDLGALFSDDSERSVWLSGASAALDGYFTLEDPRRLEPAEREWYVETELDSGLRLRGYIDRLDMTPAGDIRIVDYKTGKVPREAYEASALFQMKFYALVIWRVRGVIPRMLQLMYLADGELLRYSPDEADLRATQRKLEALWQAIEKARAAGDWRARPGKLCDWCRHKSLCPEFGGTPPPLPAAALPVTADHPDTASPDPASSALPVTADHPDTASPDPASTALPVTADHPHTASPDPASTALPVTADHPHTASPDPASTTLAVAAGRPDPASAPLPAD